MKVRFERLAERRVAVVHHTGTEDDIEQTRRPLYRHMIMEELVGGPSAIRFGDDGTLDLLVGTHLHFEGDQVARVETLPAGLWAVGDYEGPPAGLPAARAEFLEAVRRSGHAPAGALVQVHHMDAVEGAVEEQFQVPV